MSFTGESHGSRATITDGNWIDPTYLPSTRSAQRIKLPEIIAARDPGHSRLKSLRIREQQGEIPQAIRPSNSQNFPERGDIIDPKVFKSSVILSVGTTFVWPYVGSHPAIRITGTTCSDTFLYGRSPWPWMRPTSRQFCEVSE